jgi:pimeloyl-ACP methyl ester carboxylesterase
LRTHPSDKALVALMAERRNGSKSDEQRRGEREQLDARRRHDVCDRLPRVTCPTLVAGGKYDGIAPPANSEAIAALIPNAELRMYEGGHAFFAQDPNALADVTQFLSR